MKEREKADELCRSLSKKGFVGPALEAGVWAAIQQGAVNFTLEHEHHYGKELMKYSLFIEQNTKKRRYFLARFEAVYRPHIVIDDLVINAVRTSSLEARIAKIDWKNLDIGNGNQTYYSNDLSAGQTTDLLSMLESLSKNYQGDRGRSELIVIGRIVADLNKLSANNHYEGRMISEKLQLKYFEGTRFQKLDLGQLKEAIERRKTFFLGDFPNVNGHLAYHFLSGRMDALVEKIDASGLNCQDKLSEVLANNPDKFQFYYSEHRPEAKLEIQFPVFRNDQGDFTIEQFRARIKRHDSGNKPGPYINFDIGFNVDHVYNLLCGRAVILENDRGSMLNIALRNKWTQLEFPSGDRLTTDGFYHSDLWRKLLQLPILPPDQSDYFYELTNQLCRGERAAVTFRIAGRQDEQYFIEAAPSKIDVNLYDSQMRPVHKLPEGLPERSVAVPKALLPPKIAKPKKFKGKGL